MTEPSFVTLYEPATKAIHLCCYIVLRSHTPFAYFKDDLMYSMETL